ncbi:OLC1v1007846C1 [Oldenlandia corymbosa var. corymbosa]|uniref:OLC1v1007846C1 n=1 Tax=Oldenlandia corymbosa var. corymbosa TaxID=529605 RepID=A0AAV1DK45_OLDCO|nr:OLC1v1007846C1 [Oldenlandia corymbosa var. corymbosa]
MAAMIQSLPSPASVFSAYASLSGSVMLFQTALNQVIPHSVRNYIYSKLLRFYKTKKSSDLVLLIQDKDDVTGYNEIYAAAEIYLNSKADSIIECLMINKGHKEASINVKLARCGKIVDTYDGVEVVWTFRSKQKNKGSSQTRRDSYGDGDDGDYGGDYFGLNRKHFAISFDKEKKHQVLNDYIPHILERAKEIKDKKKVIKLHTLSSSGGYQSINLEHPATFETLAMDSELKKAIKEDLDMFVRRKDFYRKVGKAWKRGYLLYGPPGTGKSSLVAAIANYLKFDIYDLELTNISKNSQFRDVFLRTGNRSILVIEDIDCTVELPNRKRKLGGGAKKEAEFTLSGLLNFIDGLWSSCGDERIIVFTTNNKDKLDPALLRPGRMDMHISMSYITTEGFRTLASNYLNINNTHWRFWEIEQMIRSMNVTPAEVAEQLMRSDDPDVSLKGLSQFLNLKRERMEEGGDEDAPKEAESNGMADQTQKAKEGESNGMTDHQTPKAKRIKLDDWEEDDDDDDEECEDDDEDEYYEGGDDFLI